MYSFRYIWLTTIPFIGVGIIGRHPSTPSNPDRSDELRAGLFFLKGTQKDMNAVVDRGQIDTRHKEQNAA